MEPHIVAVHVGLPRKELLAGRERTTAIRKRPVRGPVRVDEAGLDGDRPADPDHFGPFHAVYAFAQEDLDLWSERLGSTVPPGMFGENLTTAGIDVNEALRRGAVAGRQRAAGGGRRPDPVLGVQGLGGASQATTTRPGSSGSPTRAAPVPTCACSNPAISRSATPSSSSTGPTTTSR